MAQALFGFLVSGRCLQATFIFALYLPAYIVQIQINADSDHTPCMYVYLADAIASNASLNDVDVIACPLQHTAGKGWTSTHYFDWPQEKLEVQSSSLGSFAPDYTQNQHFPSIHRAVHFMAY